MTFKRLPEAPALQPGVLTVVSVEAGCDHCSAITLFIKAKRNAISFVVSPFT